MPTASVLAAIILVMFAVVGTYCIRIKAEASRKEGFYRRIRIAGNAAKYADTRLIKRTARTAANAAADQRIHMQLL